MVEWLVPFWLSILTGSQIFSDWITKIIKNNETHTTHSNRGLFISHLICNKNTWQPFSLLYFQISKESHDHSSNRSPGVVSDMEKENVKRQNSPNTCWGEEWRWPGPLILLKPCVNNGSDKGHVHLPPTMLFSLLHHSYCYLHKNTKL